MWYDKMTIRILLLICKMLSRSAKNVYTFELDKLLKQFEEEE